MEETLIDVTELFDIKIMNQVYAQACIQAGAAEPLEFEIYLVNFLKNPQKRVFLVSDPPR